MVCVCGIGPGMALSVMQTDISALWYLKRL